MTASAATGTSVGELVRGSGLPQHEAVRLARLALGETGRPGVVLPDRSVDAAAGRAFRRLAALRREGYPLQYLEGSVSFGPIELRVDSRVLIPRPETEQLWEIVTGLVADGDPAVIVDLCTGSGNLALALKHRFPRAEVYGTDLSAAALDVARENGADLGLEVEWCPGDLFEALPDAVRGRVDLLVSNPPYVAEGEVAALPPDVRLHEPLTALVAGPTGDEILERIGRHAGGWLAPAGLIACEIAEQRPDRALEIMAPYGGRLLEDLAGRPRFVIGSARFASRAGSGEIRR